VSRTERANGAETEQWRQETVEVLSWDKIDEERVNDKITRKIFWGEKIMAARFQLAPETVIPVHDHASEQMTTVLEGSVTLSFPGGESITLRKGDMVVVPSSRPHGSVAGLDGATVLDVFSPIRQDFLESRTSTGAPLAEKTESAPAAPEAGPEGDPYEQLQEVLASVGIKVPLEELRKTPLDLLARYVYEKECITMGQLRRILGLSKAGAKDLLRQWKHGDDHSEASLKRKMERMIVLPSDIKLYKPE